MNRRPLFAFIATALLLEAACLLGQEAPPPERDPGAEEHRHAPAPPWKSVEVGDYYLRRKAYRAALSRYKEAAQADPYFPQAYLGMGKVYDRLGLRQKAVDSYQSYLDLLPSSKEAEAAREVHAAIARLKRKLKPSPSRARNHSSAGSPATSD